MFGVEVRAYLRPWNDSIDLLVVQPMYGTKSRSVAQPLTFRTLEEGLYISEPTMSLDLKAAQQLMDSLWQCGLRPTEGKGSAGALAATQAHLEDMRKLVFVVNGSPTAAVERSEEKKA